MSDVIQFSQEVLTSFSALALPWQLIIGGIATYYTAKSLLLPAVSGIFGITQPFLERISGAKTNEKYKMGKIYLHLFPRSAAPNTPNLSPYGSKLEAWLRLRKLDYEVFFFNLVFCYFTITLWSKVILKLCWLYCDWRVLLLLLFSSIWMTVLEISDKHQ